MRETGGGPRLAPAADGPPELAEDAVVGQRRDHVRRQDALEDGVHGVSERHIRAEPCLAGNSDGGSVNDTEDMTGATAELDEQGVYRAVRSPSSRGQEQADPRRCPDS